MLTSPEDQWQFIGNCEKCGAPMYFKEGKPVRVILPAPGCLCSVKKEKEEENV